VAVVTGDDVLPWVRRHDPVLMDALPGGPACAADLGDRLLSANAYLGADALLPALATGADVVHHRPRGRPGAVPGAADAPLWLAADDWPRWAGACWWAICWSARARSAAATSPTPGQVDIPAWPPGLSAGRGAGRWQPSSPSCPAPAAA
jgi:hypothetical protein